jgi:hypothetical protein
MRRISLFPVALLGVLLLAGCSTISIKTDYDRGIDFSKYRTFGWMAHPDKPGLKGGANNSFVQSRLKKAVARELEARGFTMTGGGRADLQIALHVDVSGEVKVEHYGYGYGHRHKYTKVHKYKEGTFLIDFVDPRLQQLVWRGSASTALARPEKSDKQVNEAVHRILAQYPPM